MKLPTLLFIAVVLFSIAALAAIGFFFSSAVSIPELLNHEFFTEAYPEVPQPGTQIPEDVLSSLQELITWEEGVTKPGMTTRIAMKSEGPFCKGVRIAPEAIVVANVQAFDSNDDPLPVMVIVKFADHRSYEWKGVNLHSGTHFKAVIRPQTPTDIIILSREGGRAVVLISDPAKAGSLGVGPK